MVGVRRTRSQAGRGLHAGGADERRTSVVDLCAACQPMRAGVLCACVPERALVAVSDHDHWPAASLKSTKPFGAGRAAPVDGNARCHARLRSPSQRVARVCQAFQRRATSPRHGEDRFSSKRWRRPCVRPMVAGWARGGVRQCDSTRRAAQICQAFRARGKELTTAVASSLSAIVLTSLFVWCVLLCARMGEADEEIRVVEAAESRVW